MVSPQVGQVYAPSSALRGRRFRRRGFIACHHFFLAGAGAGGGAFLPASAALAGSGFFMSLTSLGATSLAGALAVAALSPWLPWLPWLPAVSIGGGARIGEGTLATCGQLLG